jgi:hypothetical protein
MFTLSDMQRFATEAWGELGRAVVEQWGHFNGRYFAGELRPIPIIITNTQPFGKRIAFCGFNPENRARLIALNMPKTTGHGSYELVADNNTLLHEMVHQALQQRGEYAKHAGEPWCREIMRLTKLITGKNIWAGRSVTKRVEGADGKLSKVVRINEAHADGRASLGQMEIARWPHDGMGIDLGRLGEVIPSSRLPGRQRVSLVARERVRGSDRQEERFWGKFPHSQREPDR